MRQISRNQFVLLILCSSIGMASVLHAQNSSKPGKAQISPGASKPPAGIKPSAPKSGTANEAPPKQPSGGALKKASVKELMAAEMDPELEEHLKKWEAYSSKIKSLHGDQARSEFNRVFMVEQRSKGKFAVELPDKGRIEMLSNNIPEGKSIYKNDEYSVQPGASEIYICTGDAILTLEEKAKTYSKMEIPEDQRGANIVHSPLPFLFGMKAEEAKTRFILKLKSAEPKPKSGPPTVTIEAVPLWEKDQQNYQKALITLNTKNYLPIRVILIDNSNLEIVYRFSNVEINDSGFKTKVKELFGLKGDPYHPNLKSYTLFVRPENAENGKGVLPAGGTEPGKPNNAVKSPNRTGTIPPVNTNRPGGPATRK